jgi:hypothetical protein
MKMMSRSCLKAAHITLTEQPTILLLLIPQEANSVYEIVESTRSEGCEKYLSTMKQFQNILCGFII